MQHDSENLTAAPHIIPLRHLDDVRTAKQLDLAWKPAACMTDRNKPDRNQATHSIIRLFFPGLSICLAGRVRVSPRNCIVRGADPRGIYLGNTGVERALLVLPMLLILVVEFLNSAVEAVVDRHGAERHPLSGIGQRHGFGRCAAEFHPVGNRLAIDFVRPRAPIACAKLRPATRVEVAAVVGFTPPFRI